MKKREKVRTHLGIILLITMGAVLLLGEYITGVKIGDAKFAGFLCLIWAGVMIREALGKDGQMKPVKQTEFFKQLKKED